jgi:hypothetical protein
VIRFWNNDVLANTHGVLAEIRLAVLNAKGGSPPLHQKMIGDKDTGLRKGLDNKIFVPILFRQRSLKATLFIGGTEYTIPHGAARCLAPCAPAPPHFDALLQPIYFVGLATHSAC